MENETQNLFPNENLITLVRWDARRRAESALMELTEVVSASAMNTISAHSADSTTLTKTQSHSRCSSIASRGSPVRNPRARDAVITAQRAVRLSRPPKKKKEGNDVSEQEQAQAKLIAACDSTRNEYSLVAHNQTSAEVQSFLDQWSPHLREGHSFLVLD